MAAAVHTSLQGRNIVVLNVRGIYSAADETDTNILDISTLAGPNVEGPPSKLRIDEIWWAINGFSYVLLEFDRTTDYTIDYYQGQGFIDYRPGGGKVDKGTGNTGDLFLTTAGGAANATYSLQIFIRLKQ